MCVCKQSRAITWKYSGTHEGLPIVVVYVDIWMLRAVYGSSRVSNGKRGVGCKLNGWMDGWTDGQPHADG